MARTLKRRNKPVAFRGFVSNKTYRQALADLLATFHAVNSHYIAGRNPYTFDAVRMANYVLFGEEGKEGSVEAWNVSDVATQVARTRGHALLFSTPPAEWPRHLRRVVVEGDEIGIVEANGKVTPNDQD